MAGPEDDTAPPPHRHQLGRRDFLRAGAQAAVLGTGAGWLLSACTTRRAASSTAGDARIPAYVAATKVRPDLAGTADGVQPGFFSYPSNPYRSFDGTPLRGGQVTAFVDTYSPPPTPEPQNSFWKELERRLGAEFKPEITPDANYPDKLNTLTAGGDLPELVMVIPGALSHLPDLAGSVFTDLTPVLAGDAIKAYPNLANIPSVTWRNSLVDGRVYGIPIPRSVWGNLMLARQDLIDSTRTGTPKTAGDFLALAKELTDARAGRWAIGTSLNSGFAIDYFFRMWRLPNQWREDKGRLVRHIEVDGAKDAVAFARKLYQAGAFYPDPVQPQAQAGLNFLGGKYAMYIDGFISYDHAWSQMALIDSKARVRALLEPGHDGGKGSHWMGAGYFSITGINRKSSRERVQELLRVIDYFAAPFGSEEYLFLNYGIKGVDYNSDALGLPQPTDTGRNELRIPWSYAGAAPVVLFDPKFPDATRAIHQLETELVSIGVQDPTQHVYSQTRSSKGRTLDLAVYDRLSRIVAGQADLSDFDQVVKDWRSQGGDQIRGELEQGLQQQRKAGHN